MTSKSTILWIWILRIYDDAAAATEQSIFINLLERNKHLVVLVYYKDNKKIHEKVWTFGVPPSTNHMLVA
jgi:hypothetical protein